MSSNCCVYKYVYIDIYSNDILIIICHEFDKEPVREYKELQEEIRMKKWCKYVTHTQKYKRNDQIQVNLRKNIGFISNEISQAS